LNPIKFKGYNVIYAENQPEYIPLLVYKDFKGTVTSCWQFTLLEKLKILFGAKLYWSQMTFNQPLQPVMPSIEKNPSFYGGARS
jgi:hypothetical protein